MKDEYLNEHEYSVTHLSFRHDEIAFNGSGTLEWKPGKGFHLAAKIVGGEKLARKEFRSISFTKPSRILMEINSGWGRIRALTAPLVFEQLGMYMHSGVLSLDFNRILFSQDAQPGELFQDKWRGSAVYEAISNITMPDIRSTEIKIGDKKVREGWESAGFYYERNGSEEVVGEIQDARYLSFDWQLSKQYWTKSQSWNYAEALQLALSIVGGEVVSLRYFEFYRNHRMLKYYDAYGKPSSLGLIYRFFDFDILDRSLVIRLASFLSTKNKLQDIVRRIFWQAVDAANQNSQAASKLILSTILEAALRTLYDLPFVEGRPSREDPYKAKDVLRRFQLEYLPESNSERWRSIVDKVINAYERLRHRNAHPDWLATPRGMLSSGEQEQTLNDMILLSRFYGYMILALSGLKDFEPKFPAPISNWKPMVTMEKTK